MSEVATRPTYDSKFLYGELTKRLKSAAPDVEQRIVAHVRAKTKHATLNAYHANGATEEDKIALYRELIKALLTKNYSTLIEAEPIDVEPAKPNPVPTQSVKPATPAPAKVEPAKPIEVPATVTPSAPVTTPAPAPIAGVDPKMAAVIAALQAAMGQPASVAVDEAAVRKIVDTIVLDRFADLQKQVGQAINDANKTVQNYLKAIPPSQTIEIRKWDGTVTEIKDAAHKQLGLIVQMLAARNASGWSEFMYIWGAPGAGKTYLLKQMAQALGVKAYPFPCGPTSTEGKMLGFSNIANGTFVAGWLYEPYKNGGLVGLDEIALSDAGVLGATNSIENDTFTFGNGEQVQRHKDFYLVAFDNTLGTGAAGGFTRNKLDAATLNRFTHLKLEYDEDLEKRIFGNAKWADYVIKVRKYVEKNCQNSIYITPRATRKGAAYLAAGIDATQVCDMVLFSLCSKEIKETILKNVGKFTA